MVNITSVVKGSPAYRAKIKPKDSLISVNDNEINDVLDYMFYTAEAKLELVLMRDGTEYNEVVIKGEYDDLGLEFETFLMDNKRSCHNQCVFCFIDQMPPNMRDTLYFKDDDARLSFLQGNYVTLTNLSQHDVDRIIKMRLNINVSVHTTNPELRCIMMKNRFAGDKLKYLKQLADAGIKLNCQIVLCPELNDGKELERTLTDLGNLMPNIQSIAVVPVGLSKYRDNLYPLIPFDKESAGNALDIIEGFQKIFLEKWATRLVFPADEFFLTADREMPSAEYYEDYSQYENGVGMLRTLEDDFNKSLEEYKTEELLEERCISIATGKAPSNLIKKLVAKTEKTWHNLKCEVYTIRNDFFGELITVTGLITGQDLIAQLKDKNLGTELLISEAMLIRDGDIFLDDITVAEIEKELGVKLKVVGGEACDLLDSLLGIQW